MHTNPATMLPFTNSTKDMATNYGAKTPEEQQKFFNALNTLNGPDKLKKARASGLEKFKESIGTNPYIPQDKKQAYADKMLARFKEHPEKAPIDYQKFNLLVPGQHIYRPLNKPDAKPILVNSSGNNSLKDWHGPDGKIESPSDRKKNKTRIHNLGEYKVDSKQILIRGEENAMGVGPHNTPVMQMGHGLSCSHSKIKIPDSSINGRKK